MSNLLEGSDIPNWGSSSLSSFLNLNSIRTFHCCVSYHLGNHHQNLPLTFYRKRLFYQQALLFLFFLQRARLFSLTQWKRWPYLCKYTYIWYMYVCMWDIRYTQKTKRDIYRESQPIHMSKYDACTITWILTSAGKEAIHSTLSLFLLSSYKLGDTILYSCLIKSHFCHKKFE